MLNYIWVVIMIISIISSVLTGRQSLINASILDGATEAVKLLTMLLGIMSVWNGIMNIAKDSGFIKMISAVFRPVVKLLFKNIPKGSKAEEAILMNIAANLLGISNAATPTGLIAMSEMKKLSNEPPGTASDDMCLMVIMNTASIQLIPSTIIALRHSAGSGNPFDILLCVWITSILALISGIISAKIFSGSRRIMSFRKKL